MYIWLFVSIGVLVICIGVIIGIAIYNKKYESYFYEGEVSTVLAGIFGVVSLLSLIFCLCEFPKYNDSYNRHVTDIMSINRGQGVSGSFFLGSGTVKDISYYFYYHNTDKGIALGQVPTSNTYIIETDEYTPSIYEVKQEHTLDSYRVIYVPYGTIITVYTLN